MNIFHDTIDWITDFVDHKVGVAGKRRFLWGSSKSYIWNETSGRWGFSRNMGWIWLPAENTPFGWDNCVFPAWLLCVTGTVHFVPCKNESFNKALTGFAMSFPCTCPAVCGPYPTVICEICYNLLLVNRPNSGKQPCLSEKVMRRH